MVDTNDRERAHEAREELRKMLEEDELRDAVLLVFANKQDLPNALSVSEISSKLGLHSLKNRDWNVQATCATRVRASSYTNFPFNDWIKIGET